ncbi:MAG: GtrA family protein [Litoreibacter sp.]|uniref:GtrA family protein n=1 Tax=Litoreibacter sp. TaxID=1969459 RepID=UPI0032981193
MMTSLVLRYGIFAVLATFANLATQRVLLAGFGGLAVAIFFGTLVGLVVKYILDKRWIFHDTSSGVANHGKRFGLYSLMGVATTLIFWGFEYGFWSIWGTDLMRELGAIIGLAIGYVTKYNLDRRFVFTNDAGLSGANT